ncbi:MAG: EamA family transporter [Clostridiales Family XIII bacterium]|jgi:transporter family protein|nr:EamA family transporter [Clostridiales Family XIII bacterium]
MWLAYAVSSALFAGITSVLAKIGIKNVDSDLATALRTVIVWLFSWLMVFVAGSQNAVRTISIYSLVFLILSGASTGASWLCYFKALQLGDVNKVTTIDKSSTILAVVFAVLILREIPTMWMCAGMALLAAGTYLIVWRQKPGSSRGEQRAWFFYAALSAVFAALTSVLGKIGIQDIESNAGTAIRTTVVLIMAWGIVLRGKKHRLIRTVDKRNIAFIVLSGLATGVSWLCFYRALQEGNVSLVVPIDKLSVVVTIVFSRLFLKENLHRKAFSHGGSACAYTLGNTRISGFARRDVKRGVFVDECLAAHGVS